MYLIEINLNKKNKLKKKRFLFQKKELSINFQDKKNISTRYNDNFFCLIDGIVNDNLDRKLNIKKIFDNLKKLKKKRN